MAAPFSGPTFDAGASWDALTADEQRRIGVATLDHMHAILGCDERDIDAGRPFSAAEDIAYGELVCVVEARVFNGLDRLLLPSIVGAICRECGCTENDACHGGCSWIEPDLCSTCAPGKAATP